METKAKSKWQNDETNSKLVMADLRKYTYYKHDCGSSTISWKLKNKMHVCEHKNALFIQCAMQM